MDARQWFSARLRRFSRVRRHLLNAALAYRLAAAGALCGLATLIVLSGWLPGSALNLLLFAAACTIWLGLLVRYATRRSHFRSELDEAFRVESLVGGLNSRLISAWDFLHWPGEEPLVAAVIRTARADLELDVERRLDRRPRDMQRRRFAVALLLLVICSITPWFGIHRLSANLLRSWSDTYDWLFPVQFALEPGPGRQVRRLGESVDLVLSFQRRSYDQVKLVVQQGDEPAAEKLLDVDEHGHVRYRLTSPVEADYQVRFAFGRRETDPLQCIFTTAPALVNMQTEVVAPAYTGQLPRSLEGVQQRLLGLPGTRLTLGFTFSKDLESATIVWDDGQELPLEILGRFASVGLLHNQPRQARVQVRDVHGLELADPLLIDFELQTDEKPQVMLPKHLKEDMPILAEGLPLFGFGARAQDDYGVTRCVLRWQKSTVDSPSTILEQGEIERLVSPSQRSVAVTFEKIFEGLSLKPGDKVSFDLEATDNRAPQKQTNRSRRCSLFVYQEDLGKLTIAQLGFGGARDLAEARIPKSQKATAVKSPEGIRTREQVRNEFLGDVQTSTQAPVVRGEFGRATQDYFRVLSTAKYEDEPQDKQPAPGSKQDSGAAPQDAPAP